MIELSARPRLARKVKLRFDRRSGKYVLLVPEKGLALNRTASAVAQLCTGEHSVVAIIEQLLGEHVGVPRTQIEAEVLSFLQALDDRGLIEVST
jgi:coenzyme PQQ biosynthesis protein PqqD